MNDAEVVDGEQLLGVEEYHATWARDMMFFPRMIYKDGKVGTNELPVSRKRSENAYIRRNKTQRCH